MKFLKCVLLVFFVGSAIPSIAQKEISVASPDSSIIYTYRLSDSAPTYKITYKQKTLIRYSGMNLSFIEGGHFGVNIRSGKPIYRHVNGMYELVVGKAKSVRNHYHEVLIPLIEKGSFQRRINLRVRIFNDGVAFRYEFPASQSWPSFDLTEEHTNFSIVGNPKVTAMFLPGFTSSHEARYTVQPLNLLKQDSLIDMPVLFEYADNGPFMAITEASLVDYAGMYLVKRRGSLMQTELSPLPGQGGIKAKVKLPNKTPWRVIMISDKVETLMESNILTNLCEPNKIKDISWIKTGKTTWPWWNGNVLPDSLSDKGMNFETNKYYIDFCAANDIAFHSIVEYGGHEWYTSDGKNFYPGPNTDVTKPVKGLDMQKVCDYAATKGVGIRVWVHWKAIEKRLEEAFTQFETWGVKGMMIDFMDRDDQDMVNLQIKMLQVAAAHKLHVQFHGAYKPTGLHRTYPNEFTREGTLNYEVNKWDTTVNPDHDINIPFTRMLAGPTDYHLGGFRAVPGSEFKPQYIAPLMTGTRAHMLAMYVVLESYLGMLADYPDAYIGQPGFDFLKIVPTTWDEIKVVAAKPGDWVSIARRKNTDWYIGTITNRTAREENLNLSFLPAGEFEATIFSDKENSEKNPNLLDIQTITLSNKDILPIKLAAGGGQAIYLRKK